MRKLLRLTDFKARFLYLTYEKLVDNVPVITPFKDYIGLDRIKQDYIGLDRIRQDVALID